MSDKLLVERAYEIEAWVENCFLDERGVVYTYLDAKTDEPISDAFFQPGQTPISLPGTEGFSHSEWHIYENCGMTTSAYLQAQLYRYEVERDPEVLACARRSYQAIKYIYGIGKELEEGFFPKIYGNRFSEQTSTDQVLYAMLALDHFHRYADDAEKKQISHMIAEMIRFWVKRGYRYKYFWHEDMLWPLGRFTSLLLMGYKHSGDPLFKSEYERLLAEGVNQGPVESRLAGKLSGEVPPMPYEIEQQAWLIGELEGSVSMDVMELCYLLKNDPQNEWAARWKQSIKDIWKEGELTLVPDGTMYVHVLVDMKTGEPRRPEPAFFRESRGDGDWIGHRYVTGARSGVSTFVARSAVQAEPFMRDQSMRDAARLIIRSLDRKDLLAYCDPQRHLPQLTHLTDLASGDGVANWLWAYWQGRVEGVFSEDDVCIEPQANRDVA